MVSIPKPHLSPRERETLLWLGAGYSNKEIAARMGIQPNTARHYVEQVMANLEASSKTLAVVKALKLGIITLDEIQVPEEV